MFTSSKMSEASRRPHRTLAMRERAAERNGARRVVVDSRRRDLSDHLPVPGEPPAFPFESGGSYVGEWRRSARNGTGEAPLGVIIQPMPDLAQNAAVSKPGLSRSSPSRPKPVTLA